MCPSELINRLKEYGVIVYVKDGQGRIKMPDPTPKEAESLIEELKAWREEVIQYLKTQAWEKEAEQLFSEALVRINEVWPKGFCWEWLESNKPRLNEAFDKAEKRVGKAYFDQNTAEFKRAVKGFEITAKIVAKEFKEAIPPSPANH